MRIVIAVVASLIAGCATQKDVYLPDGRKGYSISCSGAALNWELCYAKAGEICQAKGYDIVTRSDEHGAAVAGGQWGVYGGTTANRSMMIACK